MLLCTTAAAQARPIRLLIFGDSLAAGYGPPHDDGFESRLHTALKAAGYDVTILDGAVSGDTSAGGRARIDWSLADTPDAAIVELGGNDGLRALSPADMQQNLAAILDTLAARKIPALLTGMEAPPNLGAEYGAKFRAVFATLGQRPGVLFDPFFLQNVAAHPELTQPDGIHPNAEGVNVIVARIVPKVIELIGKTGKS
jgi:acyl-CoA thioesterase-1